MTNKISLKNKRLKYTSYELINMIEDKIKNHGDVAKFSELYNIDIELLNKLLEHPKIISYDMYKIISKITNMSIKELTKIEIYEVTPDFRGKSDKCDNLKEFLTFSNNLFEEIITNLKIRG